jgi:hypothetical protein
MATLLTLTNEGFATTLGLSEADGRRPSVWGVARLIRREVLRRSVVTRRELRLTVEPYLSAAICDADAAATIQGVAEQMVEVGELLEVRVENQRGYAFTPPRWVRISDDEAVLLGATQCEVCEFTPTVPNQFLRRFCPSDRISAALERIGVVQVAFDAWLEEPVWGAMADSDQGIESLNQLLEWYINRLDTDGSPLRIESSMIMGVEHRPGEFFGSERKRERSRWVSCNQLKDGIYVGAQPGQNENHWVPLLIRVQGTTGRTIELHCRNEGAANADLRSWLLIAIGVKNERKEVISIDSQANLVQGTFPLPSAVRRVLCLLGEPTGKWQQYEVRNWASAVGVLRRVFPSIEMR